MLCQKKKAPSEYPKQKLKNTKRIKQSEIRIPTEPKVIYLGFTLPDHQDNSDLELS